MGGFVENEQVPIEWDEHEDGIVNSHTEEREERINLATYLAHDVLRGNPICQSQRQNVAADHEVDIDDGKDEKVAGRSKLFVHEDCKGNEEIEKNPGDDVNAKKCYILWIQEIVNGLIWSWKCRIIGNHGQIECMDMGEMIIFQQAAC